MIGLNSGDQRCVAYHVALNPYFVMVLIGICMSSDTQPIGLGVAKRKDMAGDEYLGLKPCGAGEM